MNWYLQLPNDGLSILKGRPTLPSDENLSSSIANSADLYLIDLYWYSSSINSFDCLTEVLGEYGAPNKCTEQQELIAEEQTFVEFIFQLCNQIALNRSQLHLSEDFDLGFSSKLGAKVPERLSNGILASLLRNRS